MENKTIQDLSQELQQHDSNLCLEDVYSWAIGLDFNDDQNYIDSLLELEED